MLATSSYLGRLDKVYISLLLNYDHRDISKCFFNGIKELYTTTGYKMLVQYGIMFMFVQCKQISETAKN